MNHNLRISSYNCRSLTCNAEIVKSLLIDVDILCLQETLIDENNLQVYENFDNNFDYSYVPAQRKSDCFVGRASGGLAIFWRRPLNFKCYPVTYDSRLMGLKIIFPQYKILLINAYYICDYGNIDSLIEYRSTLALTANIIDTETFDEFIALGDFNADPNKGRFYSEFNNFCNNNFLHQYDIEVLPSDSYTYISSNDICSTSWLDHVVCSNMSIISNYSIGYGVVFSDHVPLHFDIKAPDGVKYLSYDYVPNIQKYPKINWDKADDDDKILYANVLDYLCSELYYEILDCRTEKCNDQHTFDLNNFYQDLIDCVFAASLFLPTYVNDNKDHIVVGWNLYCREKYNEARANFINWHVAGRIRHGYLFEKMKSSRSSFKNALKYCRDNEMRIRKELLLLKFHGNKKEFWREISKSYGINIPKVVQIDGISDLNEITSHFDNKYKDILDDPRSQGGDVGMFSDPPAASCGPLISSDNVSAAFSELNVGVGWDGIHSNHVKFSGPKFKFIVSKFFNSILYHGFFPDKMLNGEIRPTIKNKILSKNDSNNYRPVMNSSIFLKSFEYCLLPFISSSLNLSRYQFGFRPNTSCMHAVAVVKEVISKYNKENSDVHAAFIDMSKAFDRINHNVLFQKLRNTSINRLIIDSIYVMYNTSFVNTSFNGTKSKSWKIGNGVRQGGILSPYLFCFYIDHILEEIASLPIGCAINYYKLNILGYADDLVVLAPTVTALQTIIDKLERLIDEVCLTLNPGKSQYMIFRYKKNSSGNSPSLRICDNLLSPVNKCTYLGVILTDNNDIGPDVDRVMNSFLKQFNGFHSKFYFLNRQVQYFLFKSYSTSFYGIDVWFNDIKAYQLKKISVTYHKAVKKICGLKPWDNNHIACDTANVLIFRHLLARRRLSFFHNIIKSKSPCLTDLKDFFISRSRIHSDLAILFDREYGVNIDDNPLCALLSRIGFVQRTEPRSNYVA